MWSNDGGFMEGGSGASGFVNSPSQFSSPAQGKKERRSQNIVPVTVKTIQESDGEFLFVGGSQVSMVVVVGIIRSVEVSSTKITYMIDDSTGVIEGVQWLESDSNIDEDSSKSPLMENTYCKLVGSLRTQMGKRFVMIFNIVSITDINRITTHILEVIYDSMKLQQLQTLRDSGGPMTGDKVQQERESSNLSNQASDNSGGGRMNTQGLVGPKKIIYQIIKMETQERGIHRQAICSATNGKITPFNVEKLLDELSEEGLIFTSIDDDHFKTADSF